ncbi:hypothetical protein [Burkholderia stabilis]|uniref:hypothetical protein n=1 Tax=Burkholderia stabilis TaxID=95485 RepID=UPI001591F3BE|nr:hypothetical protein [Burkholderia stabilis]
MLIRCCLISSAAYVDHALPFQHGFRNMCGIGTPQSRDAETRDAMQQRRSCCFIGICTPHIASPDSVALHDCLQRSNPALVIRNRCFPRCAKR